MSARIRVHREEILERIQNGNVTGRQCAIDDVVRQAIGRAWYTVYASALVSRSLPVAPKKAGVQGCNRLGHSFPVQGARIARASTEETVMSGRSVALEVAAVLCLVAGRAHAGVLSDIPGIGGIGGATAGPAFGMPVVLALAGSDNAAVNLAGTFRAPKRKPEPDGSGESGRPAGHFASAPTG